MVVQARRLTPERQLRREAVIHAVAVALADLLHADPARRRKALRRRAYRTWGRQR